MDYNKEEIERLTQKGYHGITLNEAKILAQRSFPEWVEIKDFGEFYSCECPTCHRKFDIDHEVQYEFCPSCGQKLEW